MISIVIPARDEARVIERCLEGLLSDAAPGEFEITVVCNGCSDDTAARARAFEPQVRVLEIPEGSKSRALDLGDRSSSGFPRFYLDADVVLDTASVRTVATALTGGIEAAAPRPLVDLGSSSWPVRAFYRVWSSLPYVREGMVGCGVYALSERGRERFAAFPEVIGDDAFVRALFSSSERAAVDAAEVRVTPPRSLAGLIRARTRSRLGLYQLRRSSPELSTTAGNQQGRALVGAVRRPSLWLALPVYVLVNGVARWRARGQLRDLGRYDWERDDSSRVGVTSTTPAPR